MDQETINKIKELFSKTTPEIKEVILSDDLNNATKELGEKYRIDINLYVDLKNIIILTLLGEIKTDSVANKIKTKLSLDEKTTDEIIKYLDQTIFEKARISIGTSEETPETKPVIVKEIKIVNDPIKAKLREQLMNHPLPKNESKQNLSEGEGNRTQLLEKLKVIEDIPNDENIIYRLEKIREQIKIIDENSDKKGEDSEELNEETIERFTKEGDKTVESKIKTAPYSKPPVSYNIDPYREVPDEI